MQLSDAKEENHPMFDAQEEKCDGIVMPQGDGGDGPKTCWLRKISELHGVASDFTRWQSLSGDRSTTSDSLRDVQKSKCTAGSGSQVILHATISHSGQKHQKTICRAT